MKTGETKETKKKRGAPKGNQNARKHGFYSKVLDEKEQAAYDEAIFVEGIDEEIALLRVKMISLLERDPENIRLISQAANTLIKLILIKHDVDRNDPKSMKKAIYTVLRDAALPLGIKIGSRFL
ncbi:MAG: hypothetical protein A2158_01535 [Chloroflexi bacterium RBG_13_46_14]|nr:MAG: hypothetical protein A2158_01535 [Chloroflexi bacterium RBG_13_46_14]